jgi:hypothetical protein
MQDMDVRSTHPAERNFHFHLLVAARRLIDIEDVDVSFSRSVLNQGFHSIAKFLLKVSGKGRDLFLICLTRPIRTSASPLDAWGEGSCRSTS